MDALSKEIKNDLSGAMPFKSGQHSPEYVKESSFQFPEIQSKYDAGI